MAQIRGASLPKQHSTTVGFPSPATTSDCPSYPSPHRVLTFDSYQPTADNLRPNVAPKNVAQTLFQNLTHPSAHRTLTFDCRQPPTNRICLFSFQSLAPKPRPRTSPQNLAPATLPRNFVPGNLCLKICARKFAPHRFWAHLARKHVPGKKTFKTSQITVHTQRARFGARPLKFWGAFWGAQILGACFGRRFGARFLWRRAQFWGAHFGARFWGAARQILGRSNFGARFWSALL